MHGDVGQVLLRVGGVDRMNILNASSQQLPRVIAFLPPGVGSQWILHTRADVGKVLVDPLATIIEGNLSVNLDCQRYLIVTKQVGYLDF